MKYVYKSTSLLCGSGTFTSNFLLRPLSYIILELLYVLYSWRVGGDSRRSFGDTPAPDLLMSQYVKAHRFCQMDDDDLLDGGTFHVNLMCLFNYAYCFASKKLSMQIMAAYQNIIYAFLF